MTPLSPESTVAEWLDHPAGGPILRRMLAENGQSAGTLRAVRRFRMSRLVALSGGRLSAEEVERLAAEANATAPGDAADVPGSADVPGAPTTAPPPRPEWRERCTPGRFTGSTVVITGAGSGIGRATASRVAREGGRVVAADLDRDRLDALAAELDEQAGHAGHPGHPGPGHEIVPVRADITDPDGIAAIVQAADGRVDALANIAGITDGMVPLHEVDDELWHRVFEVNLHGMFRLTRAVLPLMRAAGRGSIVNVSSEAALRGSTAGAAYTASKHAVVGLTRSAAFMYGPDGIRVNSVAPGGVATGIEGAMNSALGRERIEPTLAALPDIAEPEHVAASIAFLLSEDSVNINGALLPSDGGWSVQ